MPERDQFRLMTVSLLLSIGIKLLDAAGLYKLNVLNYVHQRMPRKILCEYNIL